MEAKVQKRHESRFRKLPDPLPTAVDDRTNSIDDGGMVKHAAAVLALAAGLVSAVQATAAQSAAGPAGTGHWEGAVNVQGKDLRIEVDLVAKGDAWEGAAGFPEMNSKGLVLSGIAVKGEAITFGIKGAPGNPTFKGTLGKDAKTMAGDFTQGPVAGTFTLAWKGEAKLEAPPKNAAVSKDFEGTWEGVLDVGGQTLRLNLKLINQADGATGILASIDQGGAEIPLSSIVQTNAHLKFTVPAIGGAYEGDLKDGQIVGNWTQGPGSFPLTLKRAAK